MTDQKRIKTYYSQFDEWSRLDNPEGRFEFEILLSLIRQYVPEGSTILDLGGGPGRYTAALSRLGYYMHLADLSPDLIETAKVKLREYGDASFIKSIGVADARDLSGYERESFDAVLLFGPLYHLTAENEIRACLSESKRVLKPSGILIAVYIPWLSGVKSVLARALYQQGQADIRTVQEVYDIGIFHNPGTQGFQEGHYLKSEILQNYIQGTGFEQLLLRSVRGLGNGMEAGILSLQQRDPAGYQDTFDMIEGTAADPLILNSSGHAVYVGRKA